MVQELKPLVGFDKRWIYADKVNYELSCDYLQKIAYSIADFNHTISKTMERAEICYLILLVTWIKKACESIEQLILPELMIGFIYEKQEEVKRAKMFVEALRSFVVAHPLKTSRHQKMGFDGNYICVDITRGELSAALRAFNQVARYYEFSLGGLKQTSSMDGYDYRLYIYDKRDGAQFFEYVGCYVSDLEIVINVYLKRMYALDRWLIKIRKKDYI